MPISLKSIFNPSSSPFFYTSPLHLTNLQQLLKMEIVQGDPFVLNPSET